MCRCSDLGFLLSVSGGIGSQKGSLRTRSEAWSFTRTRSPTAASIDSRLRACHLRGRGFVYFGPALRLDCMHDTPMGALCGLVLWGNRSPTPDITVVLVASPGPSWVGGSGRNYCAPSPERCEAARWVRGAVLILLRTALPPTPIREQGWR
jgi:hypothetical protein